MRRPPEPDRSLGAAVTAAAVLSACAGVIHLAMAPIHAGEARREAIAFALVGTLQLVGAAASTRSRRALLATVGLGLAAAGAWVWSRRWALPFSLGGPEDAGFVDCLTAAFEITAFVLAFVRRPIGRVALLSLDIAAVVVTVAVLAAPSTAEHGGHEHAETAAAHDPDHAETAAAHDHGACDDFAAAAPLDFPPDRLPADAAAALAALAEGSPPLDCSIVAADHGHGTAAASNESALVGEERSRFAGQWAAAVAAAARLSTPEDAAAAGYIQSSPQTPGVGTHWIDWTLVGAPFDPAHPSMVLFDQRPGRTPRLVGFSYWSRSSPGPPDGFAGPNDVWHQHTGLCFDAGWLRQEGVPTAAECSGDWLNGTDLWMLHAWVVPGLPNPDGAFAGRHPALCPGSGESVADVLTCDPLGS